MPLFIYGTLLPGLCRHYLMSGAVCLDPARLPDYVLYDTGEYPAMVPGPGTVEGLLYEVDASTLAALDAEEEYYPEERGRSEYLRRRVQVLNLETGQEVEADTYVYNREVRGMALIPEGDYLRYLERGRDSVS